MYTIKQVSEKIGISAYTLRFYDNKGLFPFVLRGKNKVRIFSEQDLEWISIVKCLRETGMPITEIKNYVDLCKQGDDNIPERYEIILKQKKKAEQEIIGMKQRLETLEKKEEHYKILLENNNKEDSWNPLNKI